MTTRFRRWLVGALAGAWLGAGVGFAQVPPDREAEARRFNEQFLFRVWDSVEGLLPTYVRDVTQTHDGYVWLVSHEGLVRFDGLRATTFSGRNVPVLPTPLRGLHARVDRAGRLWATTADGRLISLHNHEWRDWSKADGWPGFPADVMAETADGMWFAGGTNLIRASEGKFVAIALPEGAVPPLRLAGGSAGQRDLWLSDRTQVWQRKEDKWVSIAGASTLKSPVLGLAAARSGRGVWVASAQQIRRFVGSRVEGTLTRPETFRGDTVEMAEDSRGFLWVGAAQTGLRVWTPQGEILNPAGDTASLRPQITSIFEDREHNLLVGTTGAGLARFRPKLFEISLGDAGGLAGALVNAICPGEDGVLIAGTEGSGLHRIVGNKSQLITSADGQLTRRHRITAALKLRDGTVLVAVPTKGLYTVQGYNALPVPTPPAARDLVRVLFEDSTGTLWLGADRELLARPPGGEFASVPGGNLPGIRAMAELPGGELWFASHLSLARRAPGQPIASATLPGLPAKASVLTLVGERDGTLWVAVENHGLLRVRDGKGQLFGAAHGLPTLSFGGVLFHKDDLWLPGERGLLRVARSAFDSVASGRTTHLEYLHFNRGDGLPSDAFRRAAQHATAVTSDGRLWFATHKGIAGLDPTRVQSAAFQPPPIIEEVRVERNITAITPANASALITPPGSRHMTIRCSMPTLAKPEHVRFSYRLEGLEDFWHTADQERVIRFYDLPPGNYTFQVRALDSAGRWTSGAASTLGLVVQPYYWQTSWFRFATGLALVLLSGYLVWRLQQRRIALRDARLRETEHRAKLEIELQQSRQVEAIGRLAGGIAHDFNNLLTVIAGNAEIALMDRPNDSALKGLLTDQLGAAHRARDLVIQILTYSRQTPNRRISHDLAPDLRAATKLLRSGIPATTALDITLPASLPPVLADAAQIQRVITNLGTNAAQALAPSGGRIAISAAELTIPATARPAHLPPELKPGRWVHLTVEDNGHGMDDRTLKRIFEPFFTTKEVGQGTGLGLSVVQGIIAAHEGHITVNSRPQAGTRFDVYLPVTEGQPVTAPAAPKPPRALNAERILVLDDEPVVLSSTRRMLEKLGYQVDTYHDPAAALADFQARPATWQLVITDFAMPGMTGADFARQAWATRRHTNIILCTGFGGSIGVEAARDMGFVRLLNKPFTFEELAGAVAAALPPRD